MNARILHCIFAILIAFALKADPFRNLGFEEALTDGLRPGYAYPIDQLLPGWQLIHGEKVAGVVGFNLDPIPDFSYATLVDRELMDRRQVSLDRSYAFFLLITSSREIPSVRLTQRGDIPSSAQYLSYRYQAYPFYVRINGISIGPVDGSSHPPTSDIVTNALYDISRFAGQNVELTFIPYLTSGTVGGATGVSYLDSIQFIRRDHLEITHSTQSNGSQQVVITFVPHEGKNHVVEFRDTFAGNSNWQALPGGPHNSGSVTDTSTTTHRFYWLRLTDQ